MGILSHKNHNRQREQENQVRAELNAIRMQGENVDSLKLLSGKGASLSLGTLSFTDKKVQSALENRDFSTLAGLLSGGFEGSDNRRGEIFSLLRGIGKRIKSIDERTLKPGVTRQTLLGGNKGLLA